MEKVRHYKTLNKRRITMTKKTKRREGWKEEEVSEEGTVK
jgi:hypothetical protein